MAQTVQSWAARAATLPGELVRATPEAVTAGARVLESASRANLLADSGGDMRLSRVRSGKGGQMKLDVRVVGTGSRARAEVVPTGPVMLLEADTARHVQPFQYLSQRTGGAQSYSMARRRKARRERYIYIPGLGIYRASVNHPGTKGKRPVGRAFDSHHDEAGRRGLDVFARTARTHLS